MFVVCTRPLLRVPAPRRLDCRHRRDSAPGRVLPSQLYFPDEISDQILARAPYATWPGRDTTIDTDEIFPTGGDPVVLDVAPTPHGYRAGICLVLPALSIAP